MAIRTDSCNINQKYSVSCHDLDENKAVIENEVLLPIAKRLLELSDTDIGQTLAASLSTQMAKLAMQEMQGQIDGQQQQLDAQGAMLDGIQGALPPEAQAQLAQEQPMPVAPDEGDLALASPPDLGMGGTSPSLPPMPGQAGQPLPEIGESAGQQMMRPADLLEL